MLFSGLCADWKEVAWPSGYDPEKPTGSKRPAAGGGTAVKKAKTADSSAGGGESGISETEMRQAAQEDRLGKLTVANLKTFCKEKSISVKASAKKGDLIAAINEHFGID